MQAYEAAPGSVHNTLMTIDSARRSIVRWSLSMVGCHGAFLVLAPALGYPLRYEQAFRLLESLAPVFSSYLGMAAIFLVGSGTRATPILLPTRHESLLKLLLHGPIVLFVTLNVFGFVAFGISNRFGAPPDTGLAVDSLARLLTLSLSVLSATTHGLVAWLFTIKPEKET